MRSWQRLRARWPATFGKISTIGACAVYQVYALYHAGRAFPEGYALSPFKVKTTPQGTRETVPLPGEQLFRDAEDFLVHLDAAAGETSMEWKMLTDLASRIAKPFRYADKNFWPWFEHGLKDQHTLVHEARRIMAAECEVFINEDQVDSYTWGPYRNWGRALTEDDAVITFNYDRVVELTSEINVVGPRPPNPRSPNLYKLHGSVAWATGADNTPIEAYRAPDPTVDNYFPLIGIPGRSKDDLADGQFGEIWKSAGKELLEAEEVNIIGYSLPESDARSRDFLLEVLRRNETQDLKVTIVLGPPGFQTDRLETLLRFGLPGRWDRATTNPLALAKSKRRSLETSVLPFYAQDYIDTFR